MKGVIMHGKKYLRIVMMITIIKYAYMAQMSGNNKMYSRYFGDSYQYTNWILDSGATCHMTPKALDFILGSLKDIDKCIEFSDGNCIMENQKGLVQI